MNRCTRFTRITPSTRTACTRRGGLAWAGGRLCAVSTARTAAARGSRFGAVGLGGCTDLRGVRAFFHFRAQRLWRGGIDHRLWRHRLKSHGLAEIAAGWALSGSIGLLGLKVFVALRGAIVSTVCAVCTLTTTPSAATRRALPFATFRAQIGCRRHRMEVVPCRSALAGALIGALTGAFRSCRRGWSARTTMAAVHIRA